MAKKFFSIFALFAAFLLTQSIANADCNVVYKKMLNAEKSEQIKTTAQSAALTLLTFIFPPAGAAKVGSLALKGKLSADSLSSYMTVTEIESILALLKQAQKYQGEELERVVNTVMTENPEATLESVAEAINDLNQNDIICAHGVEPSTYKDILMSLGVSQELADERSKIINIKQVTEEERAQQIHPIPGF